MPAAIARGEAVFYEWIRVASAGVSPRRPMALGVLLCALSLCTCGSGKGAARSPYEAALAAKALRGASVSALVLRASDGAVLFEREPDRALIPASNAKLFTALAVLDHFGPAHRFETRITAPSAPDVSGRVAALYVTGSGDPAINNEDWWRLASELRALGLQRVAGDLVLDDVAFDSVRWHPGVEGRSARAYHAPVGALNANYGAFAVRIQPATKAQLPARVTIEPAVDYLALDARVQTGAPGSHSRYDVSRSAVEGGERVRAEGRGPAGGRTRTFYRSVLDPAAYAGAVLAMQLEAVGIAVEGSVRRGSAPAGAAELLAFEGRALSEIVGLLMKYSNNAIAETLLKAMAHDLQRVPGSFEGGARALRERLRALGVPEAGVVIADASGLSRRNRASPRALVAALSIGRQSFRYGAELAASLPIAGRDGTLESRALSAQDRARAKTGLLDGVSALSGIALAAGGQERLFSVLVNDHRGGDAAVRAALDEFLRAVVEAP